MSEFSLDDLNRIIGERVGGSAETSYTSSLLESGTEKCAQKLGEEAVETVIAAMKGDKQELVGESADLLYHLLVLLRSEGVSLDDIMTELAKRTQQSGIEEKASR